MASTPLVYSGANPDSLPAAAAKLNANFVALDAADATNVAALAAEATARANADAATLAVLHAVRTLTASAAVLSTDSTIRLDCTSVAIIATLPAAATVPGQTFALLKVDATGRLGTVACTGAETISGFATVTLEEQGAGLRVQSNGTSFDVLP